MSAREVRLLGYPVSQMKVHLAWLMFKAYVFVCKEPLFLFLIFKASFLKIKKKTLSDASRQCKDSILLKEDGGLDIASSIF
jgi:hypothetical protein